MLQPLLRLITLFQLRPGRRFMSPGFAAAACVAMCAACSDPGQSRAHVLALQQTGQSVPLPPSTNNGLAVISADEACVMDSYLVKIICARLDGSPPRTFGSEGSGPGEFGRFGFLLSVHGGGLAFVDVRNQRVSLFTNGQFVGSHRVPRPLTPASDVFDGMWDGYVPSVPSRHPTLVLQSASQPDSTQRRILEVPGDLLRDTMSVISGAVVTGRGYIARYESPLRDESLLQYDTNGAFLSVLKNPVVTPNYPDDRDIEIYREMYRNLLRQDPSPQALAEYRRRPIGWLPRATLIRTVQQDRRARTWVLTARRSDEHTEVDVFGSDAVYLRTVGLNGRVLGIQILDDVLISLAEGSDGIRRLHRYAIAD